MTSTALEEARYGNVKAITALINRSIQKRGISASVELDHGDLTVMLDAKQVPPESVAEFIFKGIQKLNIEPAYTIHIYGRKTGEPFATWCYDHELKLRPFEPVNSSIRHQITENSSSSFTIKLSDVNGKVINLDLAQALGFAGIAITILGIFSPVMTAPIVGTLTYFRNGTTEAIVLLLLTAFSAVFLVKRYYSWLYGSSIWALFLVGGTFLHYQSVISDMKASIDRDLVGNPFRGIADMAMAGTGLSWGWIFLFLGTGLVVAHAYLRKRNLDKQVFLALSLPVVVIVALSMSMLVHHAFTAPGEANKARESEARSYVSSINRSQQSFFLTDAHFASSLNQLDLSIKAENNNYTYEITLAEDDMTAVTATAQKRGLKSFIGAVFLVEDSSSNYAVTKAILCQSSRPSRTAPGLPKASRTGELQCASRSSES
ncbi:type IV pilin-like G/H family protein [Egbenema bharatensis]|uniref:type IV pilin-like G/H family protein n=1 Tax=Egbenema bharatensis TaxID=3463334 RepID=UPI003A8901FD